MCRISCIHSGKGETVFIKKKKRKKNPLSLLLAMWLVLYQRFQDTSKSSNKVKSQLG